MRKISNADVRQLQKLAWMKERGILTQDEFAQQKAHLLNSPEETRPPVRLFGSPRLVAWVVGAAAVLTVAVALSMTSDKTAAQATMQLPPPVATH